MNILVNSPDFMEKKMFYDKNIRSYQEQFQNPSTTKDEKSKIAVVIKNLTIDSVERSNAETQRESFLSICFW